MPSDAKLKSPPLLRYGVNSGLLPTLLTEIERAGFHCLGAIAAKNELKFLNLNTLI